MGSHKVILLQVYEGFMCSRLYRGGVGVDRTNSCIYTRMGCGGGAIQGNRALLVLPHAFSSSPPGSLEFSIRSDPIGFTATIRNGYTIEHILLLLLLQLRMYII